eukprot:jgi/Picsp_1/2098/NSC_05563-R1_hypothetical protein CHLNCDRAFT_135502 [Chlorella variabilis]
MSTIQAELMGRSAARAFLHSCVSQGCANRCIPSTPGFIGTRYRFSTRITAYFNDYYISKSCKCKASESESAEMVGSESTDMLVTEGGNEVMKRPTGYRVFAMDECTLLVKEEPDGRLVLGDSYVTDGLQQELERPVIGGDIPTTPALYQDVEWSTHFDGNVFEGLEPQKWILKVYFLAIASLDPYSVDFNNIFCFDPADRSLCRCPVNWLAPPGTPDNYLRLRIRETGITVDTVDSLPDAEEVVRRKLANMPALSKLEEALQGKEMEETALVEDQTVEIDIEEQVFDAEEEDDTLNDFLVEVDDDDSDTEYEEIEGGDEAEY